MISHHNLAILRYGLNFEFVSEIVRTKSADMIKSFYSEYKDDIDTILEGLKKKREAEARALIEQSFAKTAEVSQPEVLELEWVMYWRIQIYFYLYPHEIIFFNSTLQSNSVFFRSKHLYLFRYVIFKLVRSKFPLKNPIFTHRPSKFLVKLFYYLIFTK